MLILKFTSVFVTHIFRESRKEQIAIAIDEMKRLG